MAEGSPIRFRLDKAEAALAERAVGDYALSSLRTLEVNWPVESLHRFAANMEDTRALVGRTRRFLTNASDLMGKFSKSQLTPDAEVDLSEPELELTGSALFHLGVHSTGEAERALSPEVGVRFPDEAAQRRVIGEIREAGVQAKALFRRLEPTAEERGIGWMVWNDSTKI